jgi:hypothetical protein
MSDDLPETGDKAIRWFVGFFVLGAVLEGWGAWHHDESIRALEYWGVATVLTALGVFWTKIRTWAGPRFSATAAHVATDFRWWVVAIISILSLITFSPFVEQRRWPFSAWTAPSVIHDPPSAEDIAKATAPIRTELEASQHQVALLQSQLATANYFAGNGRVLYLALEEAFKEARNKHYSLAATANEIQKGSPPLRMPGCSIVIFSAFPPPQIAQTIKFTADSQDCVANILPEPTPPQLPIDSDTLAPKPILLPSHIVVHYPMPDDALILSEGFMGISRQDPALNTKGAQILDELANQLVVALRNCDTDTQRHHKVDDNPSKERSRWTVYIDLGTVQICR